jgi:hypothetical protein
VGYIQRQSNVEPRLEFMGGRPSLAASLVISRGTLNPSLPPTCEGQPPCPR